FRARSLSGVHLVPTFESQVFLASSLPHWQAFFPTRIAPLLMPIQPLLLQLQPYWCSYSPCCCRYSPCCCRPSPFYCSYSPAAAATALAAAATAPAAAAPAPVTAATALQVQLQPLLLPLQPLLLPPQPLLLPLQPLLLPLQPLLLTLQPLLLTLQPLLLTLQPLLLPASAACTATATKSCCCFSARSLLLLLLTAAALYRHCCCNSSCCSCCAPSPTCCCCCSLLLLSLLAAAAPCCHCSLLPLLLATAAAGGDAAGSAGSAAGAGVMELRLGVLEVLLVLEQLREWVLQRARPGGGGFGILCTAQRRQQSQQATFSPQVLSELFPQRCVTGSVEAAALGANESVAALGASESAAALGARASPATGPSSAKALHTFTLESGASRCFFRDCSSLTPLAAPVPVSLADPTGSPVVARASTVLPCQVAASSQVSASGQLTASCSCHVLSHQTLIWHHRLGHPSLPRLRSVHSRLLVSDIPRSLPSLPRSPALPCLPYVEGRQRAAPHSSEFPPTTASLQTLHMDVWGTAPSELTTLLPLTRKEVAKSNVLCSVLQSLLVTQGKHCLIVDVQNWRRTSTEEERVDFHETESEPRLKV
ncbi:unnamed protein product, partial [Closterium sp. NIES-54]